MVKLSLEVVLSPFLKIFLQIFFEFVSDKISPSFELYDNVCRITCTLCLTYENKVAERFFSSCKIFTFH